MAKGEDLVACQCGDADGVCTYLAFPDRESVDFPTCDECRLGNHEGHEAYEDGEG